MMLVDKRMYIFLFRHVVHVDPWRNGSASDSRSEGCVFDSRRVHANSEFYFFQLSFSRKT